MASAYVQEHMAHERTKHELAKAHAALKVAQRSREALTAANAELARLKELLHAAQCQAGELRVVVGTGRDQELEGARVRLVRTLEAMEHVRRERGFYRQRLIELGEDIEALDIEARATWEEAEKPCTSA